MFYSNGTVREAVEEYTAKHPQADSHEVATALKANQKTVYVYMKGYAKKDKEEKKPGALPKNTKIAKPVEVPSVVSSAAVNPIDALKKRAEYLANELNKAADMKGELTRLKAAIKALEG